jgi:uncharacterized protein (TIGR00251 family)
MSHPAVQNSPEGAILAVHVQPKASKTEYAGVHGDALKFRVAAPPVEGAANEALCAYLAERFGLPKKAVTVKAGQASRHKRVQLRGIPVSQVHAVLGLAQGDRE